MGNRSNLLSTDALFHVQTSPFENKTITKLTDAFTRARAHTHTRPYASTYKNGAMVCASSNVDADVRSYAIRMTSLARYSELTEERKRSIPAVSHTSTRTGSISPVWGSLTVSMRELKSIPTVMVGVAEYFPVTNLRGQRQFP